MTALTRYLVIQDGLSEFVGRAISWLTLVMIAVLMFEIVARYFLNSPTIWAHETSTMLYGAFCILAGSYTLRHQGHVRSEVIWGVLPERVRAALDTVTYALTFAVLAIFLNLAIEFAAASWEVREFSNRSIWQPPLYPIKTVIPVAVGLLMLQVMAEFVRSVLTALGVQYDDPRRAEHEPVDPILADEALPHPVDEADNSTGDKNA